MLHGQCNVSLLLVISSHWSSCPSWWGCLRRYTVLHGQCNVSLLLVISSHWSSCPGWWSV